MVLGFERVGSDISAYAIQNFARLAFWMENAANGSTIDATVADFYFFVSHGYGREVQDCPLLRRCLQHVADQVVCVKPLGNDDDGAICLIVQARDQGRSVPFIDCFTLALRHRIDGLEGVIDDDDVCATTGECSAN